MKPSLLSKLERLKQRHQELTQLLNDPELVTERDRFRDLSREFAKLEPVVSCYDRYRLLLEEQRNTEALLSDDDPDLRQLAQDELTVSSPSRQNLEEEIRKLLLPGAPDDESNAFVEIRAGTGGQEAALFAGDLLRMYGRYVELRGWQTEVLSHSPTDQGGYREIILRVSGRQVYGRLRFESGVHRVQRIPETESQGRIHTSACTVAVLPEQPENETAIHKSELRIDTYRASGAGGQHVNKTDSAVRITHLPSGLVVECQDERSQHKNRARAMMLLQARLHERQRLQQEQEQADTRRSMVGSGDRSERIRTYNYPQGRVTDHRIGLTLHRLQEIIAGDLDELIDALRQEYQGERMAMMES